MIAFLLGHRLGAWSADEDGRAIHITVSCPGSWQAERCRDLSAKVTAFVAETVNGRPADGPCSPPSRSRPWTLLAQRMTKSERRETPCMLLWREAESMTAFA